VTLPCIPGSRSQAKSIGEVKQVQSLEAANAEIKRLKAENRTLQGERDILKSRGVLCKGVPVKYAFIKEHTGIFRVRPMCRVLHVHSSGYYKWLATPESPRTRENKALTALIIEYLEGSDKTYGSPRIHRDLKESGEHCGENRIARFMRMASIKAVRAYREPR